MGETIIATKLWWGNCLEIGHMEDREADGRVILKWISGKYVVIARDVGTGSGSCPVTGFGVSGVGTFGFDHQIWLVSWLVS
jgi:hypothetical protein